VDWLRISLLILGVILVAGIWVAHRMRTRSRSDERALDPDDWGDDTAVHIRAHRDDPDFEPVLGDSVKDLDNLLEPDDRPRRVVPQSAPRKAKPARHPEPSSRAASPEPILEPVREPRLDARVQSEPERPAQAPGAAQTRAADRARATVASVLTGLKQRIAPEQAPSPAPKAPVAEPQRPSGRPAAEERFDDVSEPRVVGRNPRARGADRGKILVLHVVAARNRPFTGVALGAALRRAGLELGAMSIYHYREDGDPPDGDPLFSVANMVAPGTLGDDDLADMTTPGVTLFLQVHACDRPLRAFEVLLETAHVLARDLGGRVLDAQQSTATNQTLAHMREDMNQWLLRHRPDVLRRKASR
jgi:cell division protein ZipA